MFSTFFARLFSLERLSIRFATRKEVRCRSGPAITKDISAGGMRIVTRQKIDPGECVSVATEGMEVHCRVVWTRSVAEGLEVGLIFDDSFDARGRWVNHLLPWETPGHQLRTNSC